MNIKKSGMIAGTAVLVLLAAGGGYLLAVRHYTGVCRKAAEMSGPDQEALRASAEGCGTLIRIVPPYPEISPVPLNVFALLMRGGYHEAMGEYKEAYRDGKMLLEVHAKAAERGKSTPPVAGTCEKLADLASRLDLPGESASYADLAIKNGSKRAGMYFFRGLGYLDAGDSRQALSDFMHALALDPSCEPCRRNMDALLQTGE